MMTGAAALVVVLVAAVGITIWVRSGESPTHPAASPPATPLTVSVPTVLILDASGSMNQADAPGPRIEAAKTAALALIDALPDNATLGLETYGTSTGSSPAELDTGCHDVRTLIPLGPLHRDAMHTTIAGLTASGYTPISLALQHAGGQLPADNSEQAIVLVSDGEDTCNSDPCQTAAQLKIAHPNLTISTIGFKTDGPTAEQLRCIATATGGLFIQAGNTTQLTTRLIATQNLDTANNSLTPTGLGDIRLGQTLTDIHATHPDFPTTTSSANTITWRDCDYTFTNGTLSAITPHNGGRTIDGLSPGTPLTKAIDLYGQPLIPPEADSGFVWLTFLADQAEGNAYRIAVDHFGPGSAGTVARIVLCHCTPQISGPPVATFDGYGRVRIGMTREELLAAIGGQPQAIDHTCTLATPDSAYITIDRRTDRVVRIITPPGTMTDRGVGSGSTPDDIRAAFASPGYTVEEGQIGGQGMDAINVKNASGELISFGINDGVADPPSIGFPSGWEFLC